MLATSRQHIHQTGTILQVLTDKRDGSLHCLRSGNCGLCAILGYMLRRQRRYERQFAHIPGPKGWPVVKNILQLDMARLPWILTEWGKLYGPVYKIGLMRTYAVVIDGYEAIHDCLVKGGRNTAGRPTNFRLSYHFKNTGFTRPFPDDVWKLLRKIFTQYTKPFGAGLHQSLEETITSQSAEMFAKFNRATETNMELDPFDAVHDTALKTILQIICGDPLSADDPVFLASKEYDTLVWGLLENTSLEATLLDTFPWLIHAPLSSSKVLKKVGELQTRVALDLKRRARARDPDQTLLGCLYEHTKGDNAAACLNEDDVLLTATSTLFGGRGIISLSFMFLLNILAHHQEIQDRIANEVYNVTPDPEEYVGLKFREDLSYTSATLLELMRYHSVAPFPAPKCTTSTTTVLGVTIPADTMLFANLWGMHHDKTFWGDPEKFRPERFLDDSSGNLIAPEDPKRRYLMPFSQGLRSCPGEQFAKNQLFVWIANTCKKFLLYPGEGIAPDSATLGALEHKFLMVPQRRKIRFEKRTFQV